MSQASQTEGLDIYWVKLMACECPKVGVVVKVGVIQAHSNSLYR